MKVQVNEARCEGFGLCNERLPETFALDEGGYAIVLADGVVAPGDEDLAYQALDSCPTRAISVLEE